MYNQALLLFVFAHASRIQILTDFRALLTKREISMTSAAANNEHVRHFQHGTLVLHIEFCVCWSLFSSLQAVAI